MKETLKARLDRIGADAESGEADQTDRPIPPHVKVGQPNRARSKVLQVRLNPAEMEELERLATRRALPVSTIAREQLLRLIAEDRADSACDAAAQIAMAASRIQSLISQIDRPASVHRQD